MVGQTDGQTDNSDFVGSSVGRGPIDVDACPDEKKHGQKITNTIMKPR